MTKRMTQWSIYTDDTPQSHQCGCIVEQAQATEELKYAVAGGEIDEQGKETIRYLNYNSIFTHAVKAIQELSDICEATARTDRRAKTTN